MKGSDNLLIQFPSPVLCWNQTFLALCDEATEPLPLWNSFSWSKGLKTFLKWILFPGKQQFSMSSKTVASGANKTSRAMKSLSLCCLWKVMLKWQTKQIFEFFSKSFSSIPKVITNRQVVINIQFPIFNYASMAAKDVAEFIDLVHGKCSLWEIQRASEWKRFKILLFSRVSLSFMLPSKVP